MNLIDCYVTKIFDKPYSRYNNFNNSTEWIVKVEYNSYGAIDNTKLIFKTEKEALKVNIGYHFLN